MVHLILRRALSRVVEKVSGHGVHAIQCNAMQLHV